MRFLWVARRTLLFSLMLVETCLVTSASSAVAAGVVEESAAAVELLENMRSAMSDLAYRGVIAYSRDNQVENMEIVHAVSDGVEQQRLVSLGGPMREVIRRGQEVKCYLHDSRTVVVESQVAGGDLFDLPDNFDQLRPYYVFMLGGRDRITQRDAQAVAIIAKDDMRYGRRIWVDKESNLPLKVEIIDGSETVVEQMVFSSLDLKTPITAEQLEPSYVQGKADWEMREPANLPIDSLRWTIQSVPTGFQIASFRKIAHSPLKRQIEHLLLSDGLASVSVYFDQVGESPVVGQPSAAGAIHSFSRKIGDFLVTTIGEVPARTAQAITNGIRRRD